MRILGAHPTACAVTTLTSYPVDSNAFHPADASRDDVLPPRLIASGTRYSVQAHIRPVNSVISCRMCRMVNDKSKQRDECSCHTRIYALKQKQLMKARFTATRPISPNVVWDCESNDGTEYPHKFSHGARTGKATVGQILQAGILLHAKHAVGKAVMSLCRFDCTT